MFRSPSRFPLARWGLVLVLGFLLPKPTIHADEGASPSARERYERADVATSALAALDIREARVQPTWIGGGPAFWYRDDVAAPPVTILADPDKQAKGPAFDHAALAEATGTSRKALRITELRATRTRGGRLRATHVRVGETWWALDAKGGSPEAIEVPPPPTPTGPPADAVEGARPTFVAPAGTVKIANKQLFFKPKDGVDARTLTTDGGGKVAYQRPRFAPDGRHVLAWRTQRAPRRTMPILDSRLDDSMRARLETPSYGIPGDPVDLHDLVIFDTRRGKPVHVDQPSLDWWGPSTLRFTPDGKDVIYEHVHRGFQRFRLVRVTIATGKSRVILDERSETFLPPMKRFLHWLGDGERLIFSSERDGWNHLYLLDARTGKVTRQLTQGAYAVRSIEKVTGGSKPDVFFTASGREPNQDPYHVHLYRVPLAGGKAVCVTPANGTHRVQWSPDGSVVIDTWSRVDQPPVVEVRDTQRGSKRLDLMTSDISTWLEAGNRLPRRFAAPGRDGKTAIWGTVFLPTWARDATRLPIYESIYAGPHSAFAPVAWSARHGLQAWAELGCVAVMIDGMGTSHRSKAFHDVAWRNLADSGFPDRIAWMKALASTDARIDLERVAIAGHSAGGYNAARALIAHPEHYKVAIATAGNHDHRTDKTWWPEVWMGYPVGPHYKAQSNIENAYRLQGKLFLVHGEADRNVNAFYATMPFVHALIEANKDFDMLLVPGAGHGVGGPYVVRRKRDFLARHLLRLEPPANYTPPDTSGACHITIRNESDVSLEIVWIGFDGQAKRYHTLAPGSEVRQHTFYGHQWEARAGSTTRSAFSARPRATTWTIR